MLDLYRKQIAYVALAIAALGSAAMYWNHRNRAVSDPTLCRDLDTHFNKLAAKAEPSQQPEMSGLAYSIRDRCESRMSKSYARCLLKAGSLAEVRGCKP